LRASWNSGGASQRVLSKKYRIDRKRVSHLLRGERPATCRLPAYARFDAKVDRSGGPKACWPWTTGYTSEGYGKFWFDGRNVTSNRFVLFRKNGRWPDQALHTCDNRACCNPAHLYDGSTQQNVADRVRRKRSAVGERSPWAVLTTGQVRMIKNKLRYPRFGLGSALARKFGVSKGTVSDIKHGRRWRHVK
jgi:hypothetical protein